MSEEQILSEIEETAREVFGRDDIKMSTQTTAEDIEEWESVTHIQLIMSIEQKFRVRFSSSDLADLATVGDLVSRVRDKLVQVS